MRNPRAASRALKTERKAERKKLRDDYKAECKRSGVRVTDEMIAEAANTRWHSRANIQKWLACHPKYDGEPDRKIRKIFRDKPHVGPLSVALVSRLGEQACTPVTS